MAELKQFVGFMLDQEHYGIDIMAVEEIIRMVNITPVPRAPIFVEGIINIRGRVIPIVDLRKKLNMKGKEIDEASRIIITNFQNRRIGLIVDKVEEVIRIEVSQIDRAPGTSSAIDHYVSGVARTPKYMLIVLDILKIFSTQEQIALANLS